MDLPPTIPTSFVPKSTAMAGRKSVGGYSSAFAFVGYGVFAVVFALAVGVFLYGRILSHTLDSKQAALAKAEAAIDPATVQGFIRLRDRLTLGAELLKGHVAPSGFYKLLEKLLPTTVRLSSIHLSFEDAAKIRFDGNGIAKSFNALAAASVEFANDGRIKDAIFSGLTVNKDNSVTFTLTASVDPALTTFTP